MAVDPIGEVRLKFSISRFIFTQCRLKSIMIPQKNYSLEIPFKKYSKFSLHGHKAKDIESIEKIDISDRYPRHGSTTFYQ